MATSLRSSQLFAFVLSQPLKENLKGGVGEGYSYSDLVVRQDAERTTMN